MRITVVMAAAALAFGLAGCSGEVRIGGDSSSPVSTPTVE